MTEIPTWVYWWMFAWQNIGAFAIGWLVGDYLREWRERRSAEERGGGNAP